MMVKLPWFSVMDTALARTAQSSATNTINLNSIYQPHGTDTHQPLWYDTWANLYGAYRVVAAKYSITFDAESGTDALSALDGEQFIWAYVNKTGAPLMGTTAATNAQVETFIESSKGIPNMHWSWLSSSTAGRKRSKVTLRGFITFRRQHNDFSNTVNDQANFGASPSEPVYLYYGMAHPQATACTDSIRVHMRVMYYVNVFHPANITQN